VKFLSPASSAASANAKPAFHAQCEAEKSKADSILSFNEGAHSFGSIEDDQEARSLGESFIFLADEEEEEEEVGWRCE